MLQGALCRWFWLVKVLFGSWVRPHGAGGCGFCRVAESAQVEDVSRNLPGRPATVTRELYSIAAGRSLINLKDKHAGPSSCAGRGRSRPKTARRRRGFGADSNGVGRAARGLTGQRLSCKAVTCLRRARSVCFCDISTSDSGPLPQIQRSHLLLGSLTQLAPKTSEAG